MDGLIDLLHNTISSPWAYLIIYAISAIDGFFPAVPSETIVITSGVFAAAGDINLALVIIIAALGAITGDHISYFIGRTSSAHVHKLMSKGRRRQAAFEWAGTALAKRGASVLIVARYIPGGRTAVTMTMGATHFPLKSFAIFDVIAGVLWAAYATVLGYIGGAAFEEEPGKGLLLGFALAFSITIVIEIVRHFRNRATNTQKVEDAHNGEELTNTSP